MNKNTTTETEVHNLTSEVEYEVRKKIEKEFEDGDQSTDNSLDYTNPNPHEVSSDDTYILKGT